MSDCLFYVFATLATISALFMVSSRSAVNSAMGMIAALTAVAADYFLLDAPFLGVLQVLVYAGAVMVLFLFIIMLLDVDKASHAKRPAAKWSVGAIVLALLAGGVAYALTHGGIENHAAPSAPAAQDGNVDAPLPHATGAKEFGYGLFTKYMLPLQIAGFLLLSAMIGVVTLSKRPKDAA
jgi:NADH-quinone oxidoreductase subunit J